jgi:uncharacterized pyridoxal phosphate-dependent enzyme
MALYEQYKLSNVINARGTFTPVGVSRSPAAVCQAVAHALSGFFIIDELQAVVCRKISEITGAEAGTVVHCTSAGITLSIAATMTGTAPEKIENLPDTTGLPHRVILPAGHSVNYGHPITQDIRLAGAAPVIVGTDNVCTEDDLGEALSTSDIACLLLVSSRLTRGASINFKKAVEVAHKHKIPVIIDGAAQDLRLEALLETGADLVLTSAQKYLSGPTSGLVIGRQGLVDAVFAQEKGIGRAMKASKESIIGVLSALEERQGLNLAAWKKEQEKKVEYFIEAANQINGINASSIMDPTGLPFSRVYLKIDARLAGIDACTLAAKLKTGVLPIWTMDQECKNNHLIFELVQLEKDELNIILERLFIIFA